MKKITLRISPDGDWKEIFVDNKLVAENHNFSAEQLLTILANQGIIKDLEIKRQIVQ